jgi:hypothetical protein
MKFKCVKSECAICGKVSLIQLFIRSNGDLAYCRARHYTGQRNGKPQFTYHPQSMDSLKTLLKTQGISLTTEKANRGQIGQSQNKEVHDLNKPEKSLNQQNMSGCRLVWFRTLAFQANDPGFKSRRPHQFFLHFKIS